MEFFGPIVGFKGMIIYYVEEKNYIRHYDPINFKKVRMHSPDPSGFALPFYLNNLRRSKLPVIDKA